MTDTTPTAKIHKFQQAGLGLAPFNCTGMHQSVTTDGESTRPTGSCAFCGTCIRYCYEITSADGKQFVVGNECVTKTDDAGLVRQVAHHEREGKKTPAQKAKEAEQAAAHEIWKIENDKQQAAIKLQREANVVKFQWLIDALRPLCPYTLRQSAVDGQWNGGEFISSITAELLNGEDPTGYSERKLNIVREIYGKTAGRANSKKFYAKCDEFDTLLGSGQSDSAPAADPTPAPFTGRFNNR